MSKLSEARFTKEQIAALRTALLREIETVRDEMFDFGDDVEAYEAVDKTEEAVKRAIKSLPVDADVETPVRGQMCTAEGFMMDTNEKLPEQHERAIYMTLVNPAGVVFVKELDFFRAQGGFTQEWGRSWIPVVARSVEEARETRARQTPPAART